MDYFVLMIQPMQQTNFEDERQEIQTRLENLNKNRLPLIFILDNLRHIPNIGSIFRTADALRIEKIYLVMPTERLHQKKLEKKSRNTIHYVKHEFVDVSEIEKLTSGYDFIALEKTHKSIPYTQIKNFSRPVALLIGKERSGISSPLLSLCRNAVHLPMNGINTSINVAAATAVVAYHIANQLEC